MDRGWAVTLSFCLLLNTLLFFSQTSVDNLAIEEGVSGPIFFDYSSSMLAGYDKGNYTLDTNMANQLPTATQGVQPDTGGFFTDIFSTIKNWVIETVPGAKFIIGMATAVPTFLATMHLPAQIEFGLGAMWYILVIGSLIMLLVGR